MNQTLIHKEPKPKMVRAKTPLFKPLLVQKKISVGSANDFYEVEADTVANKVMQMREPLNHNITHTGALLQKKCTHCKEEGIQRKSILENITPLIQRSSGSESVGHVSSHVESQINSSRGRGSLIDNGTKKFMESRFGTDFSDVKIHTGSDAIQMSREFYAQAFTVGNDIYFNEGKYSPNSDSGKHLLAHELTHTVQQRSGIERKIQKECLTTAPTENDTRYITGTGESRREYAYTDASGAEAFIRSHTGLNLICFRMERGTRTVYVVYQRQTPSSTQNPPATEATEESPSRNRICLTFDDGSENGTEQVLNELAALNIKATFFLTGINMSRSATQTTEQTRLITRMITENHRIGNHTFTHSIARKADYRSAYSSLLDSNVSNDDPAEIAAFEAEYENNRQHFATTLGASFTGFDIARLPGDGRTFSSLRSRTSSLGMSHVGWNFEFAPNGAFGHVRNNDWQGVLGVSATSGSLPGANNVILFHDRHWRGGNQSKFANLLGYLNSRFSFGVINSSGNCSNP